jgi:hypothetical protein
MSMALAARPFYQAAALAEFVSPRRITKQQTKETD